ncbi:hypothetical protein NQ317_005533, partial [Molorchus minor]
TASAAKVTEIESTTISGTANSGKTHCLQVNPKQRGNPFNVPWEYDDIVPDYQMGQRVCALFLSLRYHNLNPDYIHERLKRLGNMYMLRVLLIQLVQALTTIRPVNKTDAMT